MPACGAAVTPASRCLRVAGAHFRPAKMNASGVASVTGGPPGRRSGAGGRDVGRSPVRMAHGAGGGGRGRRPDEPPHPGAPQPARRRPAVPEARAVLPAHAARTGSASHQPLARRVRLLRRGPDPLLPRLQPAAGGGPDLRGPLGPLAGPVRRRPPLGGEAPPALAPDGALFGEAPGGPADPGSRLLAPPLVRDERRGPGLAARGEARHGRAGRRSGGRRGAAARGVPPGPGRRPLPGRPPAGPRAPRPGARLLTPLGHPGARRLPRVPGGQSTASPAGPRSSRRRSPRCSRASRSRPTAWGSGRTRSYRSRPCGSRASSPRPSPSPPRASRRLPEGDLPGTRGPG